MSGNNEERSRTRRYRGQESERTVVSGHGVLKSIGIPNVSSVISSPTTEEVEFKINITKAYGEYKGELNLVNYDSRVQINSSNLNFCEIEDRARCLAVFSVPTVNNDCCYDLVVTANEAVCELGVAAMLYAYSSASFGVPINIGGVLTSGEICIHENGESET